MKIKAESLIETIVGVVILSITLLFAISIVSHFVLSNNYKYTIRGQEAVYSLLNQTIIQSNYKDINVEHNDLLLKQNIDFSELPLIKINITAYRNDTIKIIECNRLVLVND